MTINHHPDIASLMCCSAGSQPEVFAAVIASHLSVCPDCRSEVGKLQRLGVALFEGLPVAEMASDAPVVAMRASEAYGEAGSNCGPDKVAGDVPRPLAHVLGPRLDDLAWRWAAPGVETFQIPLSEGAEGDLRLYRVKPGRALPEHGHRGQELTLVLRGHYTDELGTFGPGDVADVDGDVNHSPVACPEHGCICLTASDGSMRFSSAFVRMMMPFFRL
jgi:putative transcriptional regulator